MHKITKTDRENDGEKYRRVRLIVFNTRIRRHDDESLIFPTNYSLVRTEITYNYRRTVVGLERLYLYRVHDEKRPTKSGDGGSDIRRW